MKNKYFVTMTDTFLNLYGLDSTRRNKYVIECETLEEAQLIKKSALKKMQMKYINIIQNKPKYPASKYVTRFRNYSELEDWWKK